MKYKASRPRTSVSTPGIMTLVSLIAGLMMIWSASWPSFLETIFLEISLWKIALRLGFILGSFIWKPGRNSFIAIRFWTIWRRLLWFKINSIFLILRDMQYRRKDFCLSLEGIIIRKNSFLKNRMSLMNIGRSLNLWKIWLIRGLIILYFGLRIKYLCLGEWDTEMNLQEENLL